MSTQNKAQHTRGEWFMRVNNVYSNQGWKDMPIAMLCLNPGIEQEQANGTLIAAAPELLAALEQCRDTIQRLAKESPYGVPMWASEAHDMARAAIAKARGEGK